ncbi:DNA-binding NarL/FixJ family response regulator [Rhizobium sp. BK275]|uniref:response regulator n=1 Tax=unclassified Rhizobium TaxID=2613769 RepID=UPI00182D603A|nr:MULTISPECIES: response regulator [unclassified Rhizobium]MBB3391639.1 DNA-binding NarL/FixJ family response regulator [Rhizobium sp. BK275]MBB3410050.1 DNA-binding NarL/FixJ family response regulator [Rhizobium sp. BK316]
MKRLRGWMEIDDLRLLAGKHLLIVESGDLVADAVRLALEKAGVVIVGPASSAEIGLALLDIARIDGAILDIRIEGDVVFPLAERLQDAQIPFVFAMSVFAMPHADADIAARYGGYLLSENPSALAEIAKALFASRENGG